MYHSLNNGLVSSKSKNGTSLVYMCRHLCHGSESSSVTLHGCLCAFLTSWRGHFLCHAYRAYDHILSGTTLLHSLASCSFAAASQEGTGKSQERPRLICRALLCGGLEGCQSPGRLIFCDARHIGRKLGSSFKASCI